MRPTLRQARRAVRRQALQRAARKLDPRNVNGGVFLGLNGIVIKSHGGTDEIGFKAARSDLAYEMARSRLIDKIREHAAASATVGRRAPSSAIEPATRGQRHLPMTTAFHRARRRQLSAGAHHHQRRARQASSTPPTSGSSSAPASTSATSPPTSEITSDLGDPRGAGGPRRCRPDGRRHRPHHRRHHDARPDLPGDRTAIQEKLGMHHGAAFDIQAVCSGFVYAHGHRRQVPEDGTARRALVIGAETISRILDWNDRTTCVLFGDGAGAVVLERGRRGTSADRGVLSAHLRSDGRHRDKLYVDGGPSSTGTIGHVRMEGKRGVPPRRRQDHRRGRGRVRGRPASRPTTSTGSCRTRPTGASSRPRPTSSASPARRS